MFLVAITVLWLVLAAGCIGNDGNEAQEGLSDTEDDGLREDQEAVGMLISSSAFDNGSQIPVRYTCDGENINPPLEFGNIPEGTESLVLIIDDPDAPSGSFTHWVVWDIPPVSRIDENSVPGTVGMNSFGQTAYGGPCPSSGMHRYQFMVFALDTELNLTGRASADQIEGSMQDHILAQGLLTGRYGRT
nr:YbhB/YbcL family Raf kinase inhibitor-like protein [Methanolobus chelungpuianus]